MNRKAEVPLCAAGKPMSEPMSELMSGKSRDR